MESGENRSVVSGIRMAQALLAVAALTLTVGAFGQASRPASDPHTSAAHRGPGVSSGSNATTAQRFIVERPTLMSLGFEWIIDGDSNRTAKVDVTFRKKGETAWKPALPLMRLQNENLSEDLTSARPKTLHPPIIDYVGPNAFAGSILDLEPNTDYECRFVLSDPDGVKGPHEKTVTVHTRPEPMPATGGKTYHVYPFDYKGTRQEPSFTGLLAAYYLGAFDADYWNGYPPRVQPGDIILVHAGVYKDTAFRYYYGHVTPVKGQPLTPYGTFFDGTYYLHASGTPEKPIVIKAAGDGEVVFDGNDVAVLFDLTRANYNYFEGITVRNATIAFLLGRKGYWGADGFTLKHSRIEDISRGVHEDWGLSKDYYIADNVFIGRNPADRIVGQQSDELWGKDAAWPVPINMNPGGSEYAVKVYGQGHVVAYNRAERWHDGFDVATYGNPDATCYECGSGAIPPRPTEEEDLPGAIDFYGNDVSNMNDNCFEMDGGARNIRYFRNRCFNDANSGLSIGPGFGGPFYFYQNLYYNQVHGVGGCGGTCAGMFFYQNTIISETHVGGGGGNLHFLNNLIIAAGSNQGGRPAGGPLGTVFSVGSQTNYSSSDYNGFRTDPRAANQFQWNSPPPNVVADFDFTHKLVSRSFKTLEEYSSSTGQDKHSVLLDLDIFVKASLPDRNNPGRLYNPADYDFTLKPGSKAIDSGTVLPTITDGFTGKAPDLGAFESGREPWHFGPRQ